MNSLPLRSFMTTRAALADVLDAMHREHRLIREQLARMLLTRLSDPSLPATELAFLERFAPAFAALAAEGEDALYLDGTARLFQAGAIEDAGSVNELIALSIIQ